MSPDRRISAEDKNGGFNYESNGERKRAREIEKAWKIKNRRNKRLSRAL